MSGPWIKYAVIIVIVAFALVIGIMSVKFFGNDNPIEEAAEEVIKEETGLNVNLDNSPAPAQAPSVLSPDTKTTPSDTTITPPAPLGNPPGGTTNP